MRIKTIHDYILLSQKHRSQNNYSQALKILSKISDSISSNPLAVAIASGDSSLDQECLDLGEQHLSMLDKDYDLGKVCTYNGEQVILYLVSKFQSSGGHYKLIKEMIDSKPSFYHVILSTELAGNTSSRYIRNHFISNKIRFECCKNKNYGVKLYWLQSKILEFEPAEVNIFNHYHDSIIIASTALKLQCKYNFFHHSDHKFTLGIYCPNYRHIDTNQISYNNCKLEHGLKNIYLKSLSIKDKGYVPKDLGKHSGNIVTATIAGKNKVEHPYHAQYDEMVTGILTATRGAHVHIGRLSIPCLIKIRFMLLLGGIDQSRFTYIRWVPDVWKAIDIYSIDILINSFPYGGALTCIEAMGAGIPVIFHEHIYSEILSCLHVAYKAAFRWRYRHELLAHLEKIDNKAIMKEGILARRYYEKYHRHEFCEIDQDYWSDNEYPIASPSIDYAPCWIDWVLWTEKQVNLFQQAKQRLMVLMKKFALLVIH